MMWKVALTLAAIAAPAFALEPVTCTTRPPIGFHNVTEVNADGSFCTMVPPYGVTEVAPNEGCSNSMCWGPDGTPTKYTNNTDHLTGPPGLILSTNYAAVKNGTSDYVQITGCINSAAWGLVPTDQGGQMDSHGWLYNCKGYKKFVSLLEPASNTFCIRCCNANVDVDCDTAHSTHGCWNLIPGVYAMKDGSACAPPAGAPNTTLPSGTTSVAPGATPSGTAPGANPTPSGGAGAGGAGNTGAGNTGSKGTSAASRFSFSAETVALAAVAVMAAGLF